MSFSALLVQPACLKTFSYVHSAFYHALDPFLPYAVRYEWSTYGQLQRTTVLDDVAIREIHLTLHMKNLSVFTSFVSVPAKPFLHKYITLGYSCMSKAHLQPHVACVINTFYSLGTSENICARCSPDHAHTTHVIVTDTFGATIAEGLSTQRASGGWRGRREGGRGRMATLTFS